MNPQVPVPVSPAPMSRRPRLRDLVTLSGGLSQPAYAFWGFGLAFLKHNLDRLVALTAFGRQWTIAHYLYPAGAFRGAPTPEDYRFLATMFALSLPFLWAGLALTTRRLRTIGLSRAWAALFFLPAVNALGFAALALVPDPPGRLEPVDEPEWDLPDREEEIPLPAAAGPAAAATAGDAPPPDPGPPASDAKADPKGGLVPADSQAVEAAHPWLDRFLPETRVGSAAMACTLVVPAAGAAVLAGVFLFEQYGFALFLGVPFWLGFSATYLHGYRAPRGIVESVGVGLLANCLIGAGLFLTAVEGLVCLVMAAPLAATLGAIGSGMAWALQREQTRPRRPQLVLPVLFACLPLCMGMERHLDMAAPTFRVDTALTIDAPPAAVWPHVIEFPQLPAPTDWIFRTGIAYPLHARIEGEGVGAIRHCVFTTGAFVEPIEVWDPPRRLAFSVTETPHPMTEYTPFPGVPPPHLEDFMVSEGGEFRLVPLPGGRTRLEGTTWYRHHMWPAGYWHRWASLIMHRIHLRVLKHVRDQVARSRTNRRATL